MKNFKKVTAVLLTVTLFMTLLPAALVTAAGAAVKVLVEPRLVYDSVYYFSEGLARVRTAEGKYGYVSSSGAEVIPCRYQGGNWFSEGLASVCKDGKYGYIDKNGNEVLPFIYEYAESFNGGTAYVYKDNDYFIIDRQGNRVDEYNYVNKYGYTSSAFVAMYEDNAWGFVDYRGNIIIPYMYDSIDSGSFISGLASVCKDGKWGAIDIYGNEVFEFKYDYLGSFYSGIALVVRDEKVGYIDTNGKELLPCIYDGVIYDVIYEGSTRPEFGWITKEGKYGIVEFTGFVPSLEVNVLVNGKFVEFDQPPVIENGRTLVPFRAIAEKMGAKVDWDGDTQTVSVINGDIIIKLVIGNTTAYKNDEAITLDVPAQIVNGRTLVPVRFIAESLRTTVFWNSGSQTVVIIDGLIIG